MVKIDKPIRLVSQDVGCGMFVVMETSELTQPESTGFYRKAECTVSCSCLSPRHKTCSEKNLLTYILRVGPQRSAQHDAV